MEVSISKKVLSVVDMQADFLRGIRSSTVICKIKQLIDKFKANNATIALIEYLGFGITIPEINNKVKSYKKAVFVDKNINNGAWEILRVVDEPTYVLCGIYADYCVTETARGLLQNGKNVEIVQDCCPPYNNLGQYKFQWLEQSITEEEKRRLKFIKHKEYLLENK